MRIANCPEAKSAAKFDARAVNARRHSLLFLNDWTSLSVICFGAPNPSLLRLFVSKMSAFPPACNPAHARAIGERERSPMPQSQTNDRGGSGGKHAQTPNFKLSPRFMLCRRLSQSNGGGVTVDPSPKALLLGPLPSSCPPFGVDARCVLADALRGLFSSPVASAAAAVSPAVAVSSTAAN
uniref:Uncharacterized protein n=1 Tax=Globodera pallida TaxID=36090 RepID=A0A183CK92_GLOPA